MPKIVRGIALWVAGLDVAGIYAEVGLQGNERVVAIIVATALLASLAQQWGDLAAWVVIAAGMVVLVRLRRQP